MIERALAIRGWMPRRELLYLAALAADAETIIEVGSFAGRSTRAMADAMTSGTLYAVDPHETFTGQPTCLHEKALKAEGGDAISVEFRRNLSDLLRSSRVVYLRERSDTALPKFEGYVDLVFIDGCHQRDAVVQDISLGLATLRPGGVLVGDDFNSFHPGVRAAVRGCFGGDFTRPSGKLWQYTTA